MGLLDQLAALLGEPQRALLIEFRDVTIAPVPFDPDARDLALLVIDSCARIGTPAASTRPGGHPVSASRRAVTKVGYPEPAIIHTHAGRGERALR